MTNSKTVRKFYLCSPNLLHRKLLPAKNQRDAKLKGPIMAKELKLSFYSVESETITTTKVTRTLYVRRIHS
jgi:hypothetical protein